MTDNQKPCTETTNLNCVRTRLKNYLNNGNLEQWLKDHAPSQFEPFYSSFDIRDAGYKLAPVDANLYPAGFNNICPDDVEASTPLVRDLFLRHLGFVPKKIAILPEFHTKNKFYIDNLFGLRNILRKLGSEVEVGWESPDYLHPSDKVQLESSDGRTLTAYPFFIRGSKLVFEPFEPDFILLNNDFSSGIPNFLMNISQPIEPSRRLGWHTRKKSDFFFHYNQLVKELGEAAGIDPWHLQVSTRLVKDVNFDEGTGMDRIATAVDETIAEMQTEFDKRGIKETPFVFVKNNAGTYGMGILKVESGKELLELNRRERNKMAVGKNKLEVTEVIVQEGIPTRFQRDGIYAEPVIYLLGQELLGGFLRTNPTRSKSENLNAKGMVFEKLCMADLREGTHRDLELEMVYGTIAKLSAAAIALEIAKVEGSSHISGSQSQQIRTPDDTKKLEQQLPVN